MFKKLMYRHVVIAVVMAMVMSVMAPFAGVANAANYQEDSESPGDWVCTNAINQVLIDSGNIPSFFYRTGEDGNDTEGEEFSWGYGYGYNSVDGLTYGYGYGYGYEYFCNNYNDQDAMGTRSGFFFGNEAGDAYNEFIVPVVDGDLGGSGLPMALTVFVGNYKVYLPEGLQLHGPTGWDGQIIVTVPTHPSARFDYSDGVSVEIDGITDSLGAAGDLYMSDAVVVEFPWTLGEDDTVEVLFGADTTPTTITGCSGDQYDEGDPADPASYTLADAYTNNNNVEACYVYEDGVVYIASNHFSEFAAGTPDEDGGGGGGGGFKKTTKKATALTVSSFVDLANLKTTDWEYPIVVQMLQLGLFKGSLNAQGQKVFNMYGNMNRAEAAVLIARYLGYNDKTVVGTAPFNDVPASEWYASSVAYLKGKGIVQGKSSTTYAPGDQVSRAEFFKMMVEAYMSLHPEVKAEWDGLMATGDQPFVDVTLAHWSYKYMRLAAAKSLLNGYTENGKKVMKADKSIYRIEGGSMISKILAVK